MDPMNAFEQQLSRVATEVAGPVRPVDATAVVRSAKAAPVHRWSVRIRGFRSGVTTRTEGGFSTFSALKFVAASVIVALFGGFLLSGVLTTPDDDQTAPAAVTASPSPMTTEELLSGMVTEEVEPGVFRVVNDGYRDVSHPDEANWMDDAVIVGATGDVWRITPPRRLFKLGQEPEWDYDPGLVDIGQAKTDAGPDGRLWTLVSRGLRVFEGGTWNNPGEYGFNVDLETLAVQDDGTAWFLGRDSLGKDYLGWVPPGGEPDGSGGTDVYDGSIVPWALVVSSDGAAWLMGRREGSLDTDAFLRFDGTAWEVFPAPEGIELGLGSPFDVGPGGALWTAGDALGRHESLARLDDEGWTIFTEADGVEPWGQQPLGYVPTDLVKIAPDGSAWVNATDAVTPTCDGLARFDGETWTSFLSGRCVSDLDFAPDGSLWVVVREPDFTSEVDTYVITPEAAADEVVGTSALQVEEGPLVYVPMGNSLTFFPMSGSDNFNARYAAMLEADFGVDVEVRPHTVGGQRTDDFLEQLRTDDRLREDLGEADVVTLLIPNDEWAEPFSTAAGAEGRDPSDCGGEDHQQCLRDVIDSYKQQVDRIFDELTAIVDPAETLIRVQDFYQFMTNVTTPEAFDLTYPYWREGQEYVEQVAGQHGIPVAQVFDDFMGTDGLYIDLVADGLVGPDGLHPTAEGAGRMATLVHDLGYDLAD